MTAKKKSVETLYKETIPPKFYEKKKWGGRIDVYQCLNCGHCEDEESRIKKHVLIHKEKEGTK